ncbi:Protein of unknown function [Xaviernesmea oryzae]|uniref:Acyclic terpene utilisation N-terminal domain-containing protein n=1 Tax=Xaviernesmea oryzae TaxID=464029 RepID=A0A1X7FPH4_9HYPH|nr:Protein of unknown function [Xaviernesmea oryzae]
MDETRVLAPNGMLGTSFPEASLQKALGWDPHVIAVDAGSTDSGPADLGAGTSRYSRNSVKRDLKLILQAARSKQIPLIIGSAGGAGGRKNVDWTRDIILEIARELGLKFRLAIIYSDQDKDYIRKKLADGKIRELGGIEPLSEETIERSVNIVGMMGVEPIIEALEKGADVVLAGRASDTAVFSAVPLMRGMTPGPVWHAAKVLECGAACVEYRPAPDSMFAWLREDGFVVRPPNPELKCTPISVAAHALYENGNPFRIAEPKGTIDLSDAQYEQLADGAVGVKGSRFEEADRYTIKLEGAEMVGFQTVAIGGIADPTILTDVDDFLAKARKRTEERIERSYKDLSPADWHINYRVFGLGRTVLKGGTLSSRALGGDVGVVTEVTAVSQDLANSLCSIARHQLLHQPVARWKGFQSNYALSYGSTDLVRGPVYRFNMNCVVEPDHPLEIFDIHHENV